MRRHPSALHQHGAALQEGARVFAVRQRLEALDRRHPELAVEAAAIQIANFTIGGWSNLRITKRYMMEKMNKAAGITMRKNR